MNKRLLTILCILIIFGTEIQAQDAFFSQYFASGIYYNPALAATETSLTLSGITRTQWKSVDAPFQTSMLALTIPIKDKLDKHKRVGGVVLSIYDDESVDGFLKTTGFNMAAAYGLNITKKDLLFFGVMGGYYNKVVDESRFQWGSGFDPSLGWDPSSLPNTSSTVSQASYLDINAGVLVVHDLEKEVGTDRSEIYLGASTYHLNSPDESLIEGSESVLPVRVNLNLGALLPIKSHIGLSPNLLYVLQGDNNQVNAGMYLTYYFLGVQGNGLAPNNIELGAWYRLEDSFIFNVGMGNEIYHLGFSYDMTTSNLRYSSNGNSAYEISVKLQKPHKKTERHYTPRF